MTSNEYMRRLREAERAVGLALTQALVEDAEDLSALETARDLLVAAVRRNKTDAASVPRGEEGRESV